MFPFLDKDLVLYRRMTRVERDCVTSSVSFVVFFSCIFAVASWSLERNPRHIHVGECLSCNSIGIISRRGRS